MKNFFELLKNDFWKNNAILVQMLGLCPTLAVTSSAVNALGLSIATTCILILTNTIVSLVRKIILPEVRIPVYVLLIASLVTCTQIIMEAFMFTLYESLGIFIALIATNCIIIGRAEAYASKNNVFMSFFDGLFIGLGYTLVLVLVGSVREIIGNLPRLKAGQCDPDDRLHFCARLSPLNMRRIRASKPGGTWRDWPEELVAECHRRDTGKTYGGVYGRMSWDKPAPTMTTQFYGFGNGRFGHPEQNRAISIREGAMFQGFPRDYQFVPEGEHANISLLGKMIGNAVPVQLGKLIGETFIAHLKQLDLLRENMDGQ